MNSDTILTRKILKTVLSIEKEVIALSRKIDNLEKALGPKSGC